MGKTRDKIRNTVKTGLADFSFACAGVGGILGSMSMVGGFLAACVSWGWWWAPAALFALFTVICAGDWAQDGIPNRPAVYSAILAPSMLRAAVVGTPGEMLFKAVEVFDKQKAVDWAAKVRGWTTIEGDTRSAFTAFSMIAIVTAIVWAHRYAKDAKGAASRPSIPNVPARPSR